MADLFDHPGPESVVGVEELDAEFPAVVRCLAPDDAGGGLEGRTEKRNAQIDDHPGRQRLIGLKGKAADADVAAVPGRMIKLAAGGHLDCDICGMANELPHVRHPLAQYCERFLALRVR